MRRFLLLLTLMLPILMSAGVIHHELDYTNYNLKVETIEIDDVSYSSVEYPGLYNGNNPGEASLPCQHIALVLPLNACDIHLSAIQKDGENRIVLENQILPTQEDRIISEFSSELDFIKRVQNDFEIAKIQHVENYKDLRQVVYISICPFEYDIDSWILKSFGKISFDVEYSECERPQNNPFGGWNENYYYSQYYIQDLEFLKSLVSNPESIVIPVITEEQANSVQTRSSGEYGNAFEYTIVTNQEMAFAFERLVALKRIQGIDAGVVLIEDILSNPSFANGDPFCSINDDAGKLKAYLIANQNIIRYVLLGGKPPIIPIRYNRYGTSNDSINKITPSDLYYGTNSSSNWAYMYNGVYGYKPSTFSYSSNFYIGRLLCKNAEEVNNYLDKLEIYEHNPGLGDTEYLLNQYTHYSSEISGWINSYKPSMQASISQFYANSVYSGTTNDTHQGYFVIDEINNAHRGLLNIHGHGNPEGISSWDSDHGTYGISTLDSEYVYQHQENNNGIDNISSFGYPSIFYAGTCNTTAFDSPRYQNFGLYFTWYDILSYNIAESFTLGKNYGGVAYIGNTRPLYVNADAALTTNFFNQLNTSSTRSRVGDSMFNSILLSDCADHRDIIGHALIGDPHLSIWKGNQLPIVTADRVIIDNNDQRFSYPLIPSSQYDLEGNKSTLIFSSHGGNIVMPEVPNNRVRYIKEINGIPYISDLNIVDTILSGKKYIYANNLNIGTSTTGNDAVTFKLNSRTTLDLKGTATLNKRLILEPFSKLIIWSPGAVKIKEPITFGLGSKLIIYSDFVIVNSTMLNSPYIETHPYDKYGTSNQTSSHIIIREENKEYIPLLENGKTWKYNMMGYVGAEFKTDKMQLSLGNAVMIDEEEYLPLLSYTESSNTIVTLAYLREDITERKIWLRRDTVFDELAEDPMINYLHMWLLWDFEGVEKGKENYILYDYENPSESHVIANESYLGNGSFYAYGKELEMTEFGSDKVPQLGIVEGVGCVSIPFEDRVIAHSTLLGCYGNPLECTGFIYPYLYEVSLGDGTVVYYNRQYDPEFTGKADITANLKIHHTPDGILISGAASNEATVYNMQGMKILSMPITNGNGVIPTGSLPWGVYLLSIDGQSFKIKK